MTSGKTCIFSELFSFIAKKRATHNEDYDDLTLVTIWQSGIDEGFIDMIVLTMARQIINQWLNDKIMNESSATLLILQKE